MILLPTTEEITKTLFKLNPNKTPGPDGLTSGFFKSAWPSVGQEVIAAVSYYFITGFMPAATNSTILSLIPKKPGSTKINDFRPISCCNTIYKVISKLLVARLKPLIPEVTVKNQTAFVKGRLLVENVLLAGELVHGYHHSNGPKRITIKMDIAKAFDTLNWDFLFSCLRGLEIPELYLRWLKGCVCTTSYSVGYNGSIHGYFKGTRGLRQGDPLSPYLFVLAMNALSLMLNKAVADGKFAYHYKCAETQITHLCFADDLLIFTHGSLQSVTSILQVLKEFEEVSGLALSLPKTTFFSSGLSPAEVDLISTTTGIANGKLPIRYLGLPLCTKKLTLEDCDPFIQKVRKRMTTWSAKTLSFAGRLQLLNSVISGITTFWCSAFILPKRCITLLNSMSNAFLWKGSLEGHHSARVAWTTVTLPKLEGGLGIRDIYQWNRASALKLIWMLFFKSGSIWVAWFIKEVLEGDLSNFWTKKENKKFSWLANKLIRMREIIYPWIKMQVGNGQRCRFWIDNWSPYGQILTYLKDEGTQRLGITLNTTLSRLWVNGSWRLPNARSDKQVQIQTFISTISISNVTDSYEWWIDDTLKDGHTISTIYSAIRTHQPLVLWCKTVWCSGGIKKHSFLTWLMVLNRCPTRDRILRWGLQSSSLCLLCGTADESRDHLFFRCPFSWNLWSQVCQRASMNPLSDWEQVLIYLCNFRASKAVRILHLVAWQATLYFIWIERNNRLHNQISKSATLLFGQIDHTVRNRDSNPSLASEMLQMWFGSNHQ